MACPPAPRCLPAKRAGNRPPIIGVVIGSFRELASQGKLSASGGRGVLQPLSGPKNPAPAASVFLPTFRAPPRGLARLSERCLLCSQKRVNVALDTSMVMTSGAVGSTATKTKT